MDSSEERDPRVQPGNESNETELPTSTALYLPDPENNHVLPSQAKDHRYDLAIQVQRAGVDPVPDGS